MAKTKKKPHPKYENTKTRTHASQFSPNAPDRAAMDFVEETLVLIRNNASAGNVDVQLLASSCFFRSVSGSISTKRA